MAQAANRWSRHRRAEAIGQVEVQGGWRGARQEACPEARKLQESSEVRDSDANSDAMLQLRSGISMPRFGLGTWQSQRGGECQRAVAEALRVGYRLIDTAQIYGNEADVGQALQDARIKRDEVFIVTKLSSREHGGNHPAAALKASLARLKLEYVDLFLIHSPRGGFLLETWDSLVKLRNSGLTRAIGVSNFGAQQLLELQRSGRELPEVNQIELHCFWQQRETESLCQKLGIALMAYSPLARGSLFGSTDLARLVQFSIVEVAALAQAKAQESLCSEAALCIRWAFQKGFVVIPKSVNPQRIQGNIKALSGPGLTPRQMQEIDLLDQGFCSCPAARAMQVPWEEVATKAPVRGKGKGKSKSKGKASGDLQTTSWAEAFS